MALAKKPHAVCIPLLTLSHINVMLKLAKLLHHKGYHITFFNSFSNHQKLIEGSDSLEVLPDFKFEFYPDAENIFLAVYSCLDPCRDLIAKLNNSPNIPPVSCIVADFYMSLTLPLADELGIPKVLLWPCSAASLLLYLHLHDFLDNGDLPLKDTSYITNGYLDKPIEFIPGIKDIRLKDLPTPFWDGSVDLNQFWSFIQQVYKASAIIINTFDALESEVLEKLKLRLGLPLYAVGPLQLLEEQIPNNELRSFKANLFKVDQDCVKWLDSKQSNSVVYVNFGGEAGRTTREQLVEFAWGLANSKYPFLLIIRPDLVIGEAAMLPVEFSEEIEDRGMISGWCPQEEVLQHSSICGFLTHSGWNSTMDTIRGGVPVITWPISAEQPTNSRYTCVHWGFGMQLSKDVKRDEVEKLVRELMLGEKSKGMKTRVMEWKNSAEESARPGGSSSVNFDNLVKDVLVHKNFS